MHGAQSQSGETFCSPSNYTLNAGSLITGKFEDFFDHQEFIWTSSHVFKYFASVVRRRTSILDVRFHFPNANSLL